MLKGVSENFVIYSDGSETSLRNYIEDLERFDTALRRLFGQARNPNHGPLTVYLLSNSTDVSRTMSGNRRANVAGFYIAHQEGSFAVSHRETRSIGGQSAARLTLLHEYMHFFQFRYLPGAFPSWLQEGLSEYFSTMQFDKNGNADVGKPPYSRAYKFMNMQHIPAELLLLAPARDIPRDHMSIFYARAWLLTHMTQNDPAWAERFMGYLGALHQGRNPREAALAHFGSFAALDKTLDTYLKGRIGFRTLAEPVPKPDALHIVRLDAVAAALVPLQMERRSAGVDSDRQRVVRGKLAALAARYPNAPDVLYEYARAREFFRDSLDEQDFDYPKETAALLTLLDRVLAVQPEHARANLMKGILLLGERKRAKDLRPEAWQEGRALIVKANHADPHDPLPLQAYYESYVDQGVMPTDEALQGVAMAFSMAPELVLLRLSYAWSLAHAGEFDRAEAAVLVLANDPHDGGFGAGVLEQIRELRAQNGAALSNGAEKR